jgi:hypothetical protein
MYIVGPGIWQETLKNVENETKKCMTWYMGRNTENVKNEKCTL